MAPSSTGGALTGGGSSLLWFEVRKSDGLLPFRILERVLLSPSSVLGLPSEVVVLEESERPKPKRRRIGLIGGKGGGTSPMPFLREAPAGSSMVSTTDVEETNLGSEMRDLAIDFLRSGGAVRRGRGAEAMAGEEWFACAAKLAAFVAIGAIPGLWPADLLPEAMGKRPGAIPGETWGVAPAETGDARGMPLARPV